MKTKTCNTLDVFPILKPEGDKHLPAIDSPTPTTIAEGPSFANGLMADTFRDSQADAERFGNLAQNDPGFIRRLFATAEQKAAWEKQRLRMDMVGKARLERLRMVAETELRILATISEAIVKAAEVGIARKFYDFAQAEINAMAVNSERNRKVFMAHIEAREQTLSTLGLRLRVSYERSLDAELAAHFGWLDTATTELLEKLKQKVITYAGSIEG
jgi:hypothetical protein